MAFASNLAAINAANKALKAAGFESAAPILKAARAEHFSIEKVDGEWHALIIKPLPDPDQMSGMIAMQKGISEAFEEARDLGPIAQPALTPEQVQEVCDFHNANEAARIAALAADPSIEAGMKENEADDHGDEAPMTPEEEAQFEAERLERANAFIAAQQAQADQAANVQQATSELKNGKIWIHASSIKSPVKRVWAIADVMVKAAADAGQPRPSRAAIQDECVRQGVASGTARTQYQAWKKACDNDAANAQRAAELSAAINGRKA